MTSIGMLHYTAPMLKRFGVSLDEELLTLFDTYLDERGYTNRSEGLRDLIRQALIKREWASEETETAGVVLIVYDHHQHDLSQKLTEVQHRYYSNIISTQHVHLDHYNCMEVIMVKGKAKKLKQVADSITSIKGIKHGEFMGTTMGENIK